MISSRKELKEGLYVVDIFAYLFRFYFAYPQMHSPDGRPVNAVFGMCRMLLNLLSNKATTHVAAALDTPYQRGFRKKIYPEYKSNRKETPKDLKDQIPLLKEALRCFPISAFCQEGFEADDIMATFAHKVTDIPIVLVGSDKDLTQLVCDNVSMFDPVKNVLLDEEGVRSKMGVSPCFIPDFQALCGDSSDNIPGVPGIGPKTAAKLIEQGGNLEEILMEAVSNGDNGLQKVLKYEEEARISKDLATLRKDVPIEWNLNSLKKKRPQELESFFRRNGFNSLIGRLNGFHQSFVSGTS